MVLSVIKCTMLDFLNYLEGHSNHITSLKVMAHLLNGWILPIGGGLAVKGLRLQPAQQACLNRYIVAIIVITVQLFQLCFPAQVLP